MEGRNGMSRFREPFTFSEYPSCCAVVKEEILTEVQVCERQQCEAWWHLVEEDRDL